MKHIYHGTVAKDIDLFEPRKRYTPGGEVLADEIPARVYATYTPAYAVAHGFPWSSEDGIDIEIHDGVIELIVPKEKRSVLDQEICVYTLPDDSFVSTSEEETGLTYHSETSVVPVGCECFSNVQEALATYGGKVRFI
jgi:hypothetical protein